MRFSNEDLVNIAEDGLKSLELALSEFEGVEEYKNIYTAIEEIIGELEEQRQPFTEALVEEHEEEMRALNREYERSVI